MAKNFYGSEMAAYFFSEINTGTGVNTSEPVSKNHKDVLIVLNKGWFSKMQHERRFRFFHLLLHLLLLFRLSQLLL